MLIDHTLRYWRAGVGRCAFVITTIVFIVVAAASCGSNEERNRPFAEGTPPIRQSPPNVVGRLSIELPPFTLQPGDEKMPCYIFPLVIEGPSHIIGGGKLTVGRGMHHGNITTRKKKDDGSGGGGGGGGGRGRDLPSPTLAGAQESGGNAVVPRECPKDTDESELGGEALDILGGGSVLFGSSTQFAGEEWQSLPEGIGYRIKDGYEIVARMHYLNAGRSPITVAPKYEWYTIDEMKLVHEVAPFAWTYKNFTIPPKSDFTITSATCAFPTPMNIVTILPHMHRLGTSFRASFVGGSLDGQRFLDSPGYDPDNGVMMQYSPALDLSQHGAEGAGATFSCSWRNTLDKEVTWGVGDNEMCIMYGYAYPPSGAYSVLASDQGCIVATAP